MKERIYDFVLKHPKLCGRAIKIPLLGVGVLIGLENGLLIIPFWIAIGYLKVTFYYEKDIQEYAFLKAHKEHRQKIVPIIRKIDDQINLLDESLPPVSPRVLH